MIRIVESTNDMSQVNTIAVKLFDAKLLDDILDRWAKAPLVKSRKEIL